MQVKDRHVVDDDVITECAPLVVAHLRGEARLRVFERETPAHEARLGERRIYLDRPDAVKAEDLAVLGAKEGQRHKGRRFSRNLRARELLEDLLADARMGNGVEARQGRGVVKDHVGEKRPIQRTIARQDPVTEGVTQCHVGRTTDFYDVTSRRVGVDHEEATSLEVSLCRALARANSPRQSDSSHQTTLAITCDTTAERHQRSHTVG